MSGPTICADCQHVVDRASPPYYRMCIKHRRLFDEGFVDPPWWSKNRPYLLCKDVNAGACPLFEPLREASDALHG